MEKELLEVFDDVTKAADAAKSCDGGAEESQCLEALDRLKNFPVSYQLLVSTQVGKRLKNLTKHPRKKIQSFALGLMEVWKKIVIDETSKNDVKNGRYERKDSLKREASNLNSPRAEKVQKLGAAKVEKVPKAEQGDAKPSPEKAYSSESGTTDCKVENHNVVKTEKAPSAGNVKVEQETREVKKPVSGPPKLATIPKTNDQARDRIRGFLHEALSKVYQDSVNDGRFVDLVNACDPIRVAVTVESVLFESWGGSNGSQKAKYRSLIFNLKDQKNPDFRRKVLLGYIKAERLVDMSTTEMASDERQSENKKFEEKALFECEVGGPPKATTDQFKCGRCGKRKTTYYQMQTRSADEPMTTYVTCVNCDNRWKFC
ncbi:transcription elongation factor TFIIS [Argentina anserina]|uniref:transcription elongation factor TFIIS n=1 Tax=Argentina anserina TaxID=57926 RepID=UPI00217673FF|nr:transcription elongation factor TFIIS-like [Potentilla anserina]